MGQGMRWHHGKGSGGTGGGKGGNFNTSAAGRGGDPNKMVVQDLDGGRGSVYASLPLRPIKQRAIPSQPAPSWGLED
jgi:hypothetical protein